MAHDFDKCARQLGQEGLSLVIAGLLNRKEMVRILDRCGIIYRGIRTTSLSPIMLAEDLAEESLRAPEVAREVNKALTRLCAHEANAVSSLPVGQVKRLVKDPRQIMVKMKPEVFLWLLACDERPEVNTFVPRFRKSVERLIVQTIETSENLDFAEFASKDKELKAAQEKSKQLEEELARLQLNLQAKERAHIEHQKRIAELKALERELRHRNEELEVELRNLRKRLEEAPQWEGKVHALERENKKLEYELQRLREGREKQEFPVTKLDFLGKELTQLRQEVRENLQEISTRDDRLSRLLEGILKETSLVKSEIMKLTKPKEVLPKRLGGMNERVGIFVDVQNLFYAARDHFSARMDYAKLLDYVLRGRKLVKALAYVVSNPDLDQSGFLAMLQRHSYEPRIKERRLRQDGSAKGDWDMGMAVEIIGMADKLDVIALVSGDRDFVPLVNLIKTKGPCVEVYGFPFNTAMDLKDAADEFYPLSEEVLLR